LRIAFLPFCLWAISPNVLFAVDSGWVRDFNAATKSVTVVTSSAGAFRPGQELLIFHNGKESGKMTVSLANFSNVSGRLTSGAVAERQDIVVATAEDFKKTQAGKTTKVSFKDVGSTASSWIVNVSYSSKKAGETQTRPIAFGNIVGVKETGRNFYSQIPIDQIDSFLFEWDGSSLNGKSVTLKNRKKIDADEILSANIQKRLRPPPEAESEKMSCTVKVMKKKDPVKDRPDTAKISLEMDEPKDVFGNGEAYLLKIYSNAAFLEEFIISSELIKKEPLKHEFFLPGYLFSPGKNKIEFYIVEAEFVSGDTFEKGESKPAGEKETEFGDKNTNLELKLVQSGSKLKLK